MINNSLIINGHSNNRAVDEHHKILIKFNKLKCIMQRQFVKFEREDEDSILICANTKIEKY